MKNDSRIAGAGGSDLFPAGTYKISDGTLVYNGTPRKVHSLITHASCSITAVKWENSKGEEITGALKLLTAGALNDGTLVTFQGHITEITFTGDAMLYFV